MIFLKLSKQQQQSHMPNLLGISLRVQKSLTHIIKNIVEPLKTSMEKIRFKINLEH